VRPKDLVIGVGRRVVTVGRDPVIHRAELSEDNPSCRANLAPGAAETYTCLFATPSELDELWREFRAKSFVTMSMKVAGADAGAPRADAGGAGAGALKADAGKATTTTRARSLWLRWGSRFACEVFDASDIKIEGPREADFAQLVKHVESTGRRHL
jgi:hypothetical protein